MLLSLMAAGMVGVIATGAVRGGRQVARVTQAAGSNAADPDEWEELSPPTDAISRAAAREEIIKAVARRAITLRDGVARLRGMYAHDETFQRGLRFLTPGAADDVRYARMVINGARATGVDIPDRAATVDRLEAELACRVYFGAFTGPR